MPRAKIPQSDKQAQLIASGQCIVKKSGFGPYVARASDNLSISKYLRNMCNQHKDESAQDVYNMVEQTCLDDWGIKPKLSSIYVYLSEANGKPNPYKGGKSTGKSGDKFSQSVQEAVDDAVAAAKQIAQQDGVDEIVEDIAKTPVGAIFDGPVLNPGTAVVSPTGTVITPIKSCAGCAYCSNGATRRNMASPTGIIAKICVHSDVGNHSKLADCIESQHRYWKPKAVQAPSTVGPVVTRKNPDGTVVLVDSGKPPVHVTPKKSKKPRMDFSKGFHGKKVFDYTVVRMLESEAVIFAGPPGCGKSYTMLMVVKHIDTLRGVNKPPLRVSLYKGADDQYILGGFALRATGDGSTETIETEAAVREAAETGRPVVIDEINAVTGDIGYCLYPMLEGAGSTFLTPTGKYVTVQKGCVVGGTTNDFTGDKTAFAGLQEVNAALRDRFAAVLNIDYMTPARETGWLEIATDFDDRIRLKKLVGAANILRNNNNFDGYISHRMTYNVCKDLKRGVAIKDALEYNIANKISETHRPAVFDAAQREALI